MECKVFDATPPTSCEVGIDLTRMECKGKSKRTKGTESALYRFNQNGM